LPPYLCFFIKVSVYTFLNISVSMRIFSPLSTKLPLCFKEEIGGCAFNREVSAEHFDKPPPRQLTESSFGQFWRFKLKN
jgi:hypothetical protein